ncbi:cytochrome C oxidase subunit [Thalictrum thalictroides]|nr:cytochrome C oxidase subunit [Thalictrum thalictroides]
MYEKLQSHPNVTVRKKAKQFLFGFQAMEILKVKNSSLYVNTTDYRNYFEAFVQDKTSYPQRVVEDEEDAFQQILPYILFLACPFLFLLAMVARKGM